MEAKEAVKRVGFYEIDKTIGRGNFAVVKLAKHRITKSQLAIKMIDKKQLDESNLKKVYREVKILKMLDHPNIIKLYQVMETDQFLYLVSEYAPNGELFDYIAKNGKMLESDARKMFWQIICAVDYCHQKGIVHRDLKAENLLLGLDMSIKIADFGFGNFFKPGEELSTWCGSPPYAAPEVFEGRKYYGPEVDVWSLGVVLYVLVCGAFPFDGENLHALRDRVVSGRFRIPYFMSSDCENLIRKMLVVEPKRRISVTQIKDHRWMESMHVREDLIMQFRDVAISDLKRPQISEIYNEHILAIMENAGIDRQRTVEAVENEDYNNFYAIYNLLLDKLKLQQHSRKLFAEYGHAFSDSCPRRPSTISDQAMICPGHRAPVLADTKQGPFSQTTDCVQLQEVPAIGQRQQMIHTDPCSSRPLLPPRGATRVVPAGRVFAQTSVGRAIATTSIDEGVETDYDEENDVLREAVGQMQAPLAAGVNEAGLSGLTRADVYGCFGHVGLPNLPLNYPAASFDSNIELDVISNVSSSPSGSITNSGMPTDNAETPECSGDIEEDTIEEQKDSSLVVEFREGRRASDGLMVHGGLEFQQHFKKSMKTRGVAELRKELEKLQLEASGDYEMKHRVRPGSRFMDVRNLQQRSLEENVSNFRGPNFVVKRTSLPFVDYGTVVLQKRLALRHGIQSSVCYEGSHSAAFTQDSDVFRGPFGVPQHFSNLKPIKSQPLQVLPYCSSPNRQLWLLQTSLKAPTHKLSHHLQPLEHGEDTNSASRFGLLPSQFSQLIEDQTLAKNPDNPLRSLSPSYLPCDIPVIQTGLSADMLSFSSSQHPKSSHFIPTCHSQGNLLEYGSNVDSLQSRDTASLGTLLKHPTYSSAMTTTIATETQEPDAMKRHMVRRTLFRLAQQQTLVSPCGEDANELSLGGSADFGASESVISKTNPSTSMDIS